MIKTKNCTNKHQKRVKNKEGKKLLHPLKREIYREHWSPYRFNLKCDRTYLLSNKREPEERLGKKWQMNVNCFGSR